MADIAPELWPAARERVSRWADRNKTLRPMSGKVLRFYLEHINHTKGYDWHSAETIAKDLAVHVSALEKAHQELAVGGIILRDRVAVKGRRRGAAWMWRTTIPALVKAAAEVAIERAAKAEEPTQKIPKSPPKKSEEPTQERAVESIKESQKVESLSPPTPRSRRKRRDRGARGRADAEIGSEADRLPGEVSTTPAAPEEGLPVEFINEKVVLSPAEEAYWLAAFGGDPERLRLALMQIAVQPHSSHSIVVQVRRQLARQAAQFRDQERRYQAARAASTTSRPRPQGTVPGHRPCGGKASATESQPEGFTARPGGGYIYGRGSDTYEQTRRYLPSTPEAQAYIARAERDGEPERDISRYRECGVMLRPSEARRIVAGGAVGSQPIAAIAGAVCARAVSQRAAAQGTTL